MKDFRGRGKSLMAARATVMLSRIAYRLDPSAQGRREAEALELQESLPPTPEFVEALASGGSDLVVQGERAKRSPWPERAVSIGADWAAPTGACDGVGAWPGVGGRSRRAPGVPGSHRPGEGPRGGSPGCRLPERPRYHDRLYEGPVAALEVLEESRRLVRGWGLREVGLSLQATRLEPLTGQACCSRSSRRLSDSSRSSAPQASYLRRRRSSGAPRCCP